MEARFITQSIKGINRDTNKDSILFLDKEEFLLYILFDGVSSSKNAKKGIEFIKKYIYKNIEKYCTDDVSLENLFFHANSALLHSEIIDGYTTCSCLYIGKKTKKLKILNLGDSRIYFISKQYKEQLTIDDKEFENSNEITKSLGMNLSSSDIQEKVLNLDDYNHGNFLLCSDGFYHFLENNKVLFHGILRYKRLGNIKNRLNREIKGRNTDDSTYIYIINNKNV